MKHIYSLTAGATIALLGLVGCVDDNYKINDANTLSRISINDLTIPLNLEKICLDSIVDLTDGTNVEIYKDPTTGREYYALTEEGDVESDPIEVDPIDVECPTVAPSSVTVNRVGGSSVSAKRAEGSALSFGVEAMESDFEYVATNIDKSVESINALETTSPVRIAMKLKIPSSLSISKTTVSNLRLEFPKGLKMADGSPAKANVGKYDAKTGYLTIESLDFANPHETDIYVTCDCFDFNEANAKIGDDRRFTYAGTMGVSKQGQVSVVPTSGATLPSSFDFSAEYDMASFSVANFTGDINYTVDNVEIAPIHLDDLPDFLQDPQTRIIMADPQFYFSLENPTAKYGTKGEGRMEITSSFNFSGTYNVESPVFEIPAMETSNICLSPTGNVKSPLGAYTAGLAQYPYPGMKYMLSGDPNGTPAGLPSQIEVAFADPRFFGHATRFPVTVAGSGKTAPSIKGHYKFFAPLGFDTGSIIVYAESADIGGDEMDNVFVKYLTIRATGESSFPVNVSLSATAYDMEDNILGRSNALNIPALSTEPIELKISADNGEEVMNGIDRLEFHATIIQEANGVGTALAPDQGLELRDLKFTVSGYYEKKF